MGTLQSLSSSLGKVTNAKDNELLADLISTGNALLFVGAGFSKDCLNVDGQNPPLASALSEIIGKAIVNQIGERLNENEKEEIMGSKNLMFTSDFYLKHIEDRTILIDLLKRNFTITSPTPSQIDICKVKWRRTYTTNYDNAIELALTNGGKTVTSLDLSDSPISFRDANDICVHINGKLDKVKNEDFQDRIKLSTSSYLSADQFLESAWSNQFKRDIESCSALVFIGYSMYDIDIRKILFSNGHLKDKTFFITHPNESFENVYNLKTYGNVLKIGVDGFSKIAASCIDSSNRENSLEMIFALEKYDIDVESGNYEIRDVDVNNFLLFGNVDDKYINKITLNKNVENKFISRDALVLVSEQLSSGKDILLISDLGNGKTVLTKLLMSKFSRMGFDCYLHLKNTYDLFKDIEIIKNNKRKTILFIDDYSSVIDDVVNLVEQDYPNIQLVLTSRYYGYENTKHKLLSLDMSNFKSHTIDNLNTGEVDQFINLVHNLGAWGEKAGLPNSQKIRGLDINGKYQLSVLLLTILQSPFIKAKIDEIVASIFKNSKFKDTVFTMLLLDVMGVNYDRATISDLSRNEEIYNPVFMSDVGVSNLFKIDQGVIKAKSSTFSIFMLNNNFEAPYIATKLLDIVGYLDKLASNNKDDNYDDMKKSLLRFSLVEKILPKKRTEIKYYYEKLKERVAWLTNDPHYWVQYAMAMIPFKDYQAAQAFIDTAYSLAQRKNMGYHTNNIDTQQARLYLLRCLDASPQDAFGLFKNADDIFRSIPNDIYKYRQVIRYDEIYKKKYANFSKGDKVFFEQACKRIIPQAQKAIENPIDLYANDVIITRARDSLQRIIDNIEAQR